MRYPLKCRHGRTHRSTPTNGMGVPMDRVEVRLLNRQECQKPGIHRYFEGAPRCGRPCQDEGSGQLKRARFLGCRTGHRRRGEGGTRNRDGARVAFVRIDPGGDVGKAGGHAGEIL